MKEQFLRIAIAQINCTVGGLGGNAVKIKENIKKAEAAGADIVVFPELAVTGYPPEDLLIKPKFISDNLAKIKEIAANTKNIIAVVGFVDKDSRGIYNAAAIIYAGKIKGIYRKVFLPNYGVFDEKRYFIPGDKQLIFKYGDFVFGVNICEDIWHTGGPVKNMAKLGAKLILNINASPYHAGKNKERQEIIRRQAKENNLNIVYVNLVGGQDELVFDGQSMVVNQKGNLLYRAKAFAEGLLIFDLKFAARLKKIKSAILIAPKPVPKNRAFLFNQPVKPLEPVEEIYKALELGLADYVVKNGFGKVALGLSGGIDSALVATLACDALGKENVIAVFMPSRYSSAESEEDARILAQNLGIKFLNIPIEETYRAFLNTLEPHFTGLKQNIAEENLQARIRGNILMALSNKFGWLVLATGNKSEMSTGYATLYGDMAGGLAVIKDVLKTQVYELVKYRNSIKPVIPDRIITKEPTAELKPNQKDSDTLPIYSRLDQILKAYVEEDKDISRIVKSGIDRQAALKVSRMVDKSEYKRRQSPPGIKITHKAFGRDRRMPITNKYAG